MHSSLKNGLNLLYIVIEAAVVMFAVNLDFYAVLTARPAAALQFSVTATDLHWVISGYMLALASCLMVERTKVHAADQQVK
jgi:hypothetical protein